MTDPTDDTTPRQQGGRLSRRRAITFGLVLVPVIIASQVAGRWLIVSRSVGQPDIILVLASHEWERLPAAARLARQYPDATVLLTKPQFQDQWACYDCALRPEVLERAGVGRDRITVLEDPVTNTLGEARAALGYFQHHETLRRLLVVTSPYHCRRALAVLRHVFGAMPVEIGVEPAMKESGASPATWWAHGYDAWYVMYEWAALAKYTVLYEISPFVE